MSSVKRIKDPIYGYIDIPSEFFSGIIDRPSFQRLRRIIQTSYAPLYASALHNRFVHSLGVFHLGNIVAKTINDEVKRKEYKIEKIDSVLKIFRLACLLHDVGHAPFSHTGEKFYLNGNPSDQYKELHDNLKNLVKSKALCEDIPNNDSKAAAPHEIMSAIIGIQEFKLFLPTEFEQEFFVRCITGYKYTVKSFENSFYNCLISLLNSKVIDVDRLDYLIRDAFFTGFATVIIDYERLLTSLTIIEVEKKEENHEPYIEYEIAYKKNAISVIENVVYAHDSERKWIQNHPIVLYEIYMIQHIMHKLDTKISNEKRLFSMDALSIKGVILEDNLKVSLLSDDDIIYLMKSNLSDTLSLEYFDRNSRRYPLWKSEAEYKALFLERFGGGDILKKVENALKETEKYVKKNSEDWTINTNLIEKLDEELKEINNGIDIPKNTLKSQKITKQAIKKVFNSLSEYSVSQNQSCDFVLLSASQFYSGFNKPDVSNINIVFETSDETKISKFGKIVSLLNSEEKWRDDFFYLYHKRTKEKVADKKKIFNLLMKEFIN